MSTHTVFVYGSLLSGLHNNDWLGDSPRTDVATIQPDEGLAMMDLTGGCYPHVGRAGQRKGIKPTVILGEVYEVTDDILEDLDRLEGCPTHYTRETVKATLASGEVVTTFVYVACEDVFANSSADIQVMDGNWRRHENSMDSVWGRAQVGL